MPKHIDRSGEVYGVWEILRTDGHIDKYVAYIIRCSDCGHVRRVRSNYFYGNPPACRECRAERKRTLSQPGYKHWENNRDQMVPEWRDSYQQYATDGGGCGWLPQKRREGQLLGPDNVVWTRTRKSELVEHDGLLLTKKEWAKKLGITKQRVIQRLQKLPLEEALDMNREKGEAGPVAMQHQAEAHKPVKYREFFDAVMSGEAVDGQVRVVEADENMLWAIRGYAKLAGVRCKTRLLDGLALIKLWKE